MSECILIRHAQTDWNKRKVFRGRKEVELNRTGIRQAEKTSTLLAELPVETIYTSPLKRALITAQILKRPHPNVEVKEVPSFIDIDYGEWQGLSEDDVKNNKLYLDWITKPESVTFPGGESLEDVKNRALPVFEEIIKTCKLSIIVTHRIVIKIILLHIMGLKLSSFWSVRQDPCGITRIEFMDNKFIISSLNETHHLYKPSVEVKEDF
ncbi:MAG: histidine phosphatase family protein [bacterium]